MDFFFSVPTELAISLWFDSIQSPQPRGGSLGTSAILFCNHAVAAAAAAATAIGLADFARA